MKTGLVIYEEAIRAVAACRSVDEVKSLRDVAARMKLYAMQANDRRMEADALEIQMRATLRLGEMIEAQKRTVGLAKGGQPYKNTRKSRETTGVSETPVETRSATLTEAGIDKNLAKEARKAFNLQKEDKFEDAVKEGRASIINRAGKRSYSPKIKTITTAAKLLGLCGSLYKVVAQVEELADQLSEEDILMLVEVAQDVAHKIRQFKPNTGSHLTIVKG